MLAGMAQPVHVLQRGDEIRDIVNLAAVASVEASRSTASGYDAGRSAPPSRSIATFFVCR
jgi:hypothetical protein